MAASKGNGKGGGSRAAAARAEKSDETKTLKYEGLEFELPAQLPDTILFDMAEIEAAGDNPLPMFRMLRSILGQAQFGRLRQAVEDGDVKAENLDQFIEGVFAEYGITPGE